MNVVDRQNLISNNPNSPIRKVYLSDFMKFNKLVYLKNKARNLLLLRGKKPSEW